MININLENIKAAIAAGVIFFCLTADGLGQKVTRQSAVNAFSRKNYELALNQFTELLSNFPADPLYKYYCGASLVELKEDPAKASVLLNQAAYESGAVRSVPPDCFFYLGRALQMTGKFQDAIQAYNRFVSIAGKKVSKDMNVPDLVKQCNEQKGAISPSQPLIEPVPPAERKDSTLLHAHGIHHADTLPSEYDRLLAQALETRLKEDSLSKVSDNKKKLKAGSDSVAAKIAEMAIVNDSAKLIAIKDTAKPHIGTAQQGTPVFAEFSVDEKAGSKAEDKVTVDPLVPPGLIYRIQVAVFRNPVLPAFFKGISPVQGFKNPATGITAYYAGRFRRSADAGQALLKVKSIGFRDAFVVALMDKKVVSNERAAVLEKEWGTKPLFTIMPSAAEQVRDTIPPTLIFRVEVKRSAKPLPEDQVEALKKMATGRGFDIVSPESKLYIYLIGKFLTYNSATEFADLLVRNGYKEARVAAWLGKKEIPVETARQLFEQKL